MAHLNKMILEHFTDISELQHKVFKLITKADKHIENDVDYETLKKIVTLYRDNEKELSSFVEMYERRLEFYEDEHKEKVNIQKGKEDEQ